METARGLGVSELADRKWRENQELNTLVARGRSAGGSRGEDNL